MSRARGAHRSAARRRHAVLAALGLTVLAVLLVVAAPRSLVAPPRWLTRGLIIGFLWAALLAQLAAIAVAPVLAVWLGLMLAMARRRGQGQASAAVARGLLLSVSLLVGLGCAELAARAALTLAHRFPSLPTTFAGSRGARGKPADLSIVVVGESSARGEPYDRWLSAPAIVAWQLERIFPGRKVSVQMLARGGDTLATAHARLAQLRRRPDAVLVYSGHNEFQSRFPWERYVPWYQDENPPRFWDRLEDLGRSTALGRWMVEAIDKQRLDRAPPPVVTRDLIDVPAFTDREARETLADYRDRLEAIARYCREIGSVPILVVPPGNDGGYEPNRSVLPPGMRRAEREAFRVLFLEARRAEATDPVRALAAYRSLVSAQPGFAEAQFRLGRLLRDAGDTEQARRCFALARDLDGMPQRCTSPLQEACREASRRYDAVLVDGPSVLARMVPDGILDDRLFHDAHHPNLVAYIALAEDILKQLFSRKAFDWPSGREPPRIDAAECAAHFGIGRDEWASLCRTSCNWYTIVAYVRFDPSERMDMARRLALASLKISAGTAPEDAGVPGYGTNPRMDAPLRAPQGE